jgi:hypothetical protein
MYKYSILEIRCQGMLIGEWALFIPINPVVESVEY